MTTPARAEIVVDLGAVHDNVVRLRGLLADGVAMMAVVKADGYGHGMPEAGRASRAAGADWLGVATLDEALALRSSGDDGRVLCWLTTPGEDWAAGIAADIDLTAYSVAELDEIAAVASTDNPARVQLKVDTGLSRGGALAVDWPGVVARARAGELDGSWRITGIWSHFVSADVPEDPVNDRQEEAFRDALQVAAEAGLDPEVRHLANSAATVLRPSSHFDLVRCGIAVYGLDPAPAEPTGRVRALGLVPAMTVRASLALVKDLAVGDAVSYGHLWTAEQPTTVGLVPIGYAEGVLIAASNRAEVWIDGARRPVRGRVCMDQFVVDLHGDRPTAGSDVLLLGPGGRGEPTAQDWAEACGTINYEIVTRLGGRLARRHVGGDTW